MRSLSSPSFKRLLSPQLMLPSASRVAEQRLLDILDSCKSPLAVLQIQSHLIKSGLQSDRLVITKFTATCSSVGAPPTVAASLLFAPGAPIHLYDAFLFNTVIRSFANDHSGHGPATQYFSVMLRLGLYPNKFTFPFILKACAVAQNLKMGKQYHSLLIKFGFEDDPFVCNTLIHMYAAGGIGLECARKLFDRMPKTCSVTWNAMIGGYVRSGMSNEAVMLFREMQVSGVPSDDVTLINVLAACADLGALDLVTWIKYYIDKEGIPKTLELCNALVDSLAKCGDIDGAIAFFKHMPKKSTISWTSLIDGLAMHGRGREAVATFESMRNADFAPDDVAFIGVLSACSHAGFVDEGCGYFDSMKEYGITPKIEHYGCMVDLFSRAGQVERAVNFVRSMPVEPNPVIMRTLIAACRIHGKFELGEEIIQSLLTKEPDRCANYVVSSNIYATMRQWDKKSSIRNEMDRKGISKVPGCTSLEVDGVVYEFMSGDKSNPYNKEIHKMVEEMMKNLKRAGFLPMTSEVLLDIDEDDKGDVLHLHSEKLAIAFALLRTAPGTPIRIVKNLRVCVDCHSATKFISKVYNREIVVRDKNRFHLFKDGVCSCNDFW